MNTRRLLILAMPIGLAMLIGPLAAPAFAEDRASPDEAKAMAIKAAAYLKSAGSETAFAAFDAKDGPWHDRDLYVFVDDPTGKMLAHGGNLAFVGKSVGGMRDVDGKLMFQEMSAVKDAGWVEYKWQDPVTKAIEPKTTYIVRMGDYIVGVGAYK